MLGWEAWGLAEHVTGSYVPLTYPFTRKAQGSITYVLSLSCEMSEPLLFFPTVFSLDQELQASWQANNLVLFRSIVCPPFIS